MIKRKILKTFPARMVNAEWEARLYADGVRACLTEVRPGEEEASVGVFKSFSGETGSLYNVELILWDEPAETPEPAPRPVNEVALDLLKNWVKCDPFEVERSVTGDFLKFMEELNKSAEHYSGESK